MTAVAAGLSPDWLGLREPADAAARAPELVFELRRLLGPDRPVVVHDLGCGTGSMGRWLAPQLGGPQHWVLYDREPGLLLEAAAALPASTADGSAVSVATRERDLATFDPAELRGASLITASALLDMLTATEVERLVGLCVDAGSPALLTLSVVGRVDLLPAEPLDAAVTAAFNAHQRRTTGGRRLLGPDAVALAAGLFERLGAEVVRRPSAWRLDAADSALIGAWFEGWWAAACEQRPELSSLAADWVGRRRAAVAAGRLRVRVHHEDLLVRPPGWR